MKRSMMAMACALPLTASCGSLGSAQPENVELTHPERGNRTEIYRFLADNEKDFVCIYRSPVSGFEGVGSYAIEKDGAYVDIAIHDDLPPLFDKGIARTTLDAIFTDEHRKMFPRYHEIEKRKKEMVDSYCHPGATIHGCEPSARQDPEYLALQSELMLTYGENLEDVQFSGRVFLNEIYGQEFARPHKTTALGGEHAEMIRRVLERAGQEATSGEPCPGSRAMYDRTFKNDF